MPVARLHVPRYEACRCLLGSSSYPHGGSCVATRLIQCGHLGLALFGALLPHSRVVRTLGLDAVCLIVTRRCLCADVDFGQRRLEREEGG